MPALVQFRAIAWFALLWAIGGGSAAAIEYHAVIRSWDREYIGATAGAWTAAEGPDGAMYVGANGVLRFDGERWQSLPVEGGYAVRAIAFGTDGRMWIAANGQ